MGVIHITDLRESPGNQPRFGLGDLSSLLVLLSKHHLKPTDLRPSDTLSTIEKVPVSRCPSNLVAWPAPNPFGKQTVLPLL